MFFSWQLNISLQFVFALLGRWARFMLRPAVVGHRHFQLIFTDQSVQFAELRTIIFAFLYIPPLDYWPFEPPVHGQLNLDLYHFSIVCISVQCIVPV